MKYVIKYSRYTAHLAFKIETWKRQELRARCKNIKVRIDVQCGIVRAFR
jgi:hypothetical protein